MYQTAVANSMLWYVHLLWEDGPALRTLMFEVNNERIKWGQNRTWKR